MKTTVLAGIVLILSTGWLACKKSKDGGNPPPANVNLEKFTDKEWRSHKTETPWYTLRFNSDSTGVQKNIHDITVPTYFTYTFKWSRYRNDSIKINYDLYLPLSVRVYSVSDSLLVINNFIYGGAADSTKVKLYCN